MLALIYIFGYGTVGENHFQTLRDCCAGDANEVKRINLD
jgi:hypothetical protein